MTAPEMRKLFAAVLAVVLSFAITGCGAEAPLQLDGMEPAELSAFPKVQEAAEADAGFLAETATSFDSDYGVAFRLEKTESNGQAVTAEYVSENYLTLRLTYRKDPVQLYEAKLEDGSDNINQEYSRTVTGMLYLEGFGFSSAEIDRIAAAYAEKKLPVTVNGCEISQTYLNKLSFEIHKK